MLDEHDEGERPSRVVLSRAIEAADQVVEALRAHPAADRVEVAGSLRRWTDSVKDIDIIATAPTRPRSAARSPSCRSSSRVSRAARRARG